MADALPVSRTVVTNNHDIASLVRRLDRLMIELGKSQSTNVTELMPYDLNRVNQFAKMLRSYKAWSIKEPFMDTPESSPVQIQVECFGKVLPVDNDSVWDLIQLVDTIIVELANASSSRLASNLLPADSERFDAYMVRMDNLLAHIAGSEPVDSPESSPRDPNTGEGLTGIKFTAK